MNKNYKKASELKVVKVENEKSLEAMLAEKKQNDLNQFVAEIGEISKKYNCGLVASAEMSEGAIKFKINPINL